MKSLVFRPWRSSLLTGSLLLSAAVSAHAASKTYRYYEFVPNKIRAGGNSMQISEFKFFVGGNALSMTNVGITAPAADFPAAEVPANVKDDNFDTKYLDFKKFSPLIFDFTTETTIDSYNFATAGDAAERDPVSWTLQGSHDGTNWTIIDNRTDVSYPQTRKAYVPTAFTIPDNLNPLVTNFAASQAIITNGTAITLNWQVSLADSISISGIGTVAANGPTTVTPPANAVTTYTLTATNTTTNTTTTATVTVKSVAQSSVDYRYVRFTPLHLRNDTAANSIQIDDISFVGSDTPITAVAATNPGGSNPVDANEGALKAIDGLTTTKWLDLNKQPLIVDFGVPTTFDSYKITSGNDANERDPVRWYLEGSNDQNTWALIDDQTQRDYPFPSDRNTATPAIPLSSSSLTAPILNFSVDAGVLVAGDSATLSFTTLGADSASIDHGVGPVATSGTATVSPTTTTTYTLTATKGTATSTAQITVNVIPNTVTTINYPNFESAGSELSLVRDASILNDFALRSQPGNVKRLRLTPDAGSKSGAAWFAKRLDFSQGFDTTFDLSTIALATGNGGGADGMSFVIQSVSDSQMPAPTEDKGFGTKCLVVNFDSYQSGIEGATPADPSAATVHVLLNKVQIASVNLPVDFPAVLGNAVVDLTQLAGNATPYHVRITYGSGKLNVYMNNVQLLTDFAVDLSQALDPSGKAWTGFVGRTGGLFEAHDVTSWVLTTNAAGATNPLAITSYTISPGAGTATLGWSSNTGKSYKVTTSTDLVTWTPQKTGITSGGATTSTSFTFTAGSKGFFRVEEE